MVELLTEKQHCCVDVRLIPESGGGVNRKMTLTKLFFWLFREELNFHLPIISRLHYHCATEQNSGSQGRDRTCALSGTPVNSRAHYHSVTCE